MTKETLRALREEHAPGPARHGGRFWAITRTIFIRLGSGKAPLTRRVGRLAEALLVQTQAGIDHHGGQGEGPTSTGESGALDTPDTDRLTLRWSGWPTSNCA